MARPRPWQEPAHSVVVERFDDLLFIHKYLRQELQESIDKTFDNIARHIGFVVATTLPVNVAIGKGGEIAAIKVSSANLEGTIIANEFAPIFDKLTGKTFDRANLSVGSYQLIFIWYDALKLKLKHDWMEPAHYKNIGPEMLAEQPAKVRPEVQEPAHWFDGGVTLEMEEEVLISVLDEVYPELKLADRVAMARYETRKYIPGVREPAHFRQMLEEIYAERLDRKIVPGVREPAHFQKITDLMADPEKIELLKELSLLLQKLGI